MKLKWLLGVVALTHVLVHPVAHMWLPAGGAPPEAQPLTSYPASAPESASLGPCLGCRTGSDLVAPRVTSLPVPLRAFEEKLTLAPLRLASGRFRLQVPARAPPLA